MCPKDKEPVKNPFTIACQLIGEMKASVYVQAQQRKKKFKWAKDKQILSNQNPASADIVRADVSSRKLFRQTYRRLYYLYKAFSSPKQQTSTTLHAQIVLQICGEINSKPNIKLHSVEYFSKQYNLSKSTLRRIFKDKLQISFHRYVTNACMERARTYRTEDQMNMTDIAEELGYADRSGFTKTYYRYFGDDVIGMIKKSTKNG